MTYRVWTVDCLYTSGKRGRSGEGYRLVDTCYLTFVRLGALL